MQNDYLCLDEEATTTDKYTTRSSKSGKAGSESRTDKAASGKTIIDKGASGKTTIDKAAHESGVFHGI